MKWISVKDKLPGKDIPVCFIWGELHTMPGTWRARYLKTSINEYWLNAQSTDSDSSIVQFENVTHWMSLPDKPEKQ